MIEISLFFIILFTLNLVFPRKEAYPCTHCKCTFHYTCLNFEGICECCYQSACAAHDSFATHRKCIDPFDDGTIDPDDL